MDIIVSINLTLEKNATLLNNIDRCFINAGLGDSYLSISVQQPEYGIPSDFVRKSTVSLQIKISAAQLNFLNRNVVYILKVE